MAIYDRETRNEPGDRTMGWIVAALIAAAIIIGAVMFWGGSDTRTPADRGEQINRTAPAPAPSPAPTTPK
jgi:hypothetical protein